MLKFLKQLKKSETIINTSNSCDAESILLWLGENIHVPLKTEGAFTHDTTQRKAKVGNLREWSLSSLA